MPRRDPNARDANPGTRKGEPEEGPAGRGAHKVREAGTAGGSPDYRLPGEKRALGVKGP